MAEEKTNKAKPAPLRSVPEGINRIAVNVKDKELIEVSSSSKMLNKQTKESLTVVKNSAVDTLKVSKSSDKYLKDILKNSTSNLDHLSRLSRIVASKRFVPTTTKTNIARTETSKDTMMGNQAWEMMKKDSLKRVEATKTYTDTEREELKKRGKWNYEYTSRETKRTVSATGMFWYNVRSIPSTLLKALLVIPVQFTKKIIIPLVSTIKDLGLRAIKATDAVFQNLGGPFALFADTIKLAFNVISPLATKVIWPLIKSAGSFIGGTLKGIGRVISRSRAYKKTKERIKETGIYKKASGAKSKLGSFFGKPSAIEALRKDTIKVNAKTNKLLTDSLDAQEGIEKNTGRSSGEGFFSKIFGSIGSIFKGLPGIIASGFALGATVITKALSMGGKALESIKNLGKNLGRSFQGKQTRTTSGRFGKVSPIGKASKGLQKALKSPTASRLLKGGKLLGKALPFAGAAATYLTTEGSMGRKLAATGGSVFGGLGAGLAGTALTGGNPIVGLGASVAGSYYGGQGGTFLYDKISNMLSSDAKSKKASMESVKPVENPYDSKMVDILTEIKNEISKIGNQPVTSNNQSPRGGAYGLSYF